MLKEQMGHESATTTERYAKANRKAVRADAARVHAALERNFR